MAKQELLKGEGVFLGTELPKANSMFTEIYAAIAEIVNKANAEDIEFIAAALSGMKIKGTVTASTALHLNQLYQITAVGTTDFTTCGAASNTVGLTFTASGPAAGTGTATPLYPIIDDTVNPGDVDDNIRALSAERLGVLLADKQADLGVSGLAGIRLIQESILGVRSIYNPGTWKVLYTDGDANGIKELSIGTFGHVLVSQGTGGAPAWEARAEYSAKTKVTADGGMAVLLTNKTGAPSVKGTLLTPSTTVDNAVQLCAVDNPNCIGVCLDADVVDGQEMWVVVSGIASVYFSGNATRGHLARIGFADDTGEVAGQAISEAYPVAPFATDKHFAEIGHVIESRVGAGLAKCVLHFN